MQIRSSQSGSALWSVIAGLSAGIVVLIVTTGLQTVEPQTIAELEALARGNPAAEAVLAAELKVSPTPSKFRFSDIQSKVKEQLVASASQSLVDRAAPASAAQSAKKAPTSQISDVGHGELRQWDEMNTRERAVYLLGQLIDWSPVLTVVPLMLATAVVVARRMGL